MTSSSSVTSGLTMLTSGVSQYLHPDYLQPLPTTLDAKKSPLALLAQTCSAIGKDTPSSKSIIPPLEKNSKENNNNSSNDNNNKSSGDSDSSSSSKRPGSHGHKDSGRESTSGSSSSAGKPGFRAFPPKEIPPLVPIPSPHAESHTTTSSGSGSTSKSGRISSSAEPAKPASSPLLSGAPTSLTVPSSTSSSSLPRPVSANGGGAPRTSSRNSNSGKAESSGEHHHHHHHQHGSHHHHHSQQQHTSSNSNHHSSSSSHHHHRQRDSPASSSNSLSSSSTSISTSSHRSSSSPRDGNKPSSTSVMQSPSCLTSPNISSSSAALKHPASHPASLLGGSLPAHLAAAGYPNPLALMGHGLDASSYHNALAAHSGLSGYSAAAAAAAAAAQSSALKAAAAGAGPSAGLSPFVTYARVRTPSGATTLVPVCRDPYCTNCQLTVQNSHLSATCNAPGCAQCAHEKSLTSLSALSLPGGAAAAASSMLLPPLSSAGSTLSGGASLSALSSPLHSLYPHSALAAAAAAHQGLPYVCNWVAGSDYCGKRFNSSEELLQHLRTHTSSLDATSLAAASYAGLAGLPSALAAYPHLSAPLSPNSLRRAYPTSLSPVSSLLSASRYHPYKSPLSGVGAPPPQSLPPVGPYYSPYTLYGQRIGAAVVP